MKAIILPRRTEFEATGFRGCEKPHRFENKFYVYLRSHPKDGEGPRLTTEVVP